jgi:hypothetical protein
VTGAIVEPEDLFIQVAVKVERLDRNVGSRKIPLHQAPEVFEGSCCEPAR